VLKLAIRQAQKASSFQDASDDLREPACVPISDTHLRKLSLRIGQEWKALQDAEVAAFQANQPPQVPATAAGAAAVMLDGGRLQGRVEDAGRGVHGPHWRETKVACCLSLSSSVHAVDPQPQPPRKFLDQIEVARLTAEVKSRGRAAPGREAARAAREDRPQPRRKKEARGKRPVKPVRTVLASLSDSEGFGWRVAAEVHRRGLDKARRKARVCDGLRYNWSIYEMRLRPAGFIAILDFLHLLTHLYPAACAARGKATAAAWGLYERWLRLAWSGEVASLLGQMRQASARLGAPPKGCGDDDPSQVMAEAVGYVSNNQERMDYPRYRRLGLPISSAMVESTIKQMNRRVKGTEKFWLAGGGEAMLQLRAAHLSEDGRAQQNGAKPRPYARAASSRSLRPAS
jgi:hypothetical protein